MRMSRSSAWAFGVPVLALAASACGGTTTTVGQEDASADAAAEPTNDAGADAEAQDSEPPPDATNTCDVFVGVDYGLAPCH
jgi:hypothetical protein